MLIRYHGSFAVDIPGHDDVEPDQVVDVPEEVAETLLDAGASYHETIDEHGERGVLRVAPEVPLWTVEEPAAKPLKEPKNPPADPAAAAGKD